ncbi:MAG: hypothetical protein KDK00_00725 [Rhodobacteraceae bacterium]|nr:hypothetical protein [Paracoccaceae bacterium]
MTHGLMKFAAILVTAFALTACGDATPPASTTAPKPLGDFKLGYAVVSADNVQKAPMSRDATADEWEAVLKPEFERRLSGYQGERFYHVSITVAAYSLAMPGIPLVFSPKSAVVIMVNVWDDARQVRIIEQDKQFTVVERLTAKSILGSGLTMSREEQMAELSTRVIDQVMKYLEDNADAFSPDTPPAPAKDA